jgi:hypothetical protein
MRQSSPVRVLDENWPKKRLETRLEELLSVQIDKGEERTQVNSIAEGRTTEGPVTQYVELKTKRLHPGFGLLVTVTSFRLSGDVLFTSAGTSV